MGKDEKVLIDTSSWIEALRSSGHSDVRERVRNHLLNGMAAWCDMVAVELWNGARGAYEKKKLAEMEKEMICLPTTKEVWQLARNLAQKCRKTGYTVPSSDLVIISCALFHKVEVEYCDEHFDVIIRASKGMTA